MSENNQDRLTDEKDVNNIKEILSDKESLPASQDKMYRMLYEASDVDEESTDDELIRAIIETLKIIEKDEREIIDQKMKNMQDVIQEEYESRVRLEKKLSFSRMTMRFAVCLILVLSLSSIVVNAFGYNFFEVIINWGENTFNVTLDEVSMEDKETIIYDYEEIAMQISETLRLPDQLLNYSYNYAEVSVRKGYKSYNIYYTNDEDKIIYYNIISYRKGNNEKLAIEKDEDNVIIYEKEGISHYIMTNLDQLQAVWQNKNNIINLYGDVTVEDMKEIINSNYGG